MAEEGIKVEGEVAGATLSPQVAQEKQEERARKDGWRPIEEFKGDPADWVDFKEFLGRQKLFDKIHDLKNQLSRQSQKFETDMSRISSHFAKVRETEYARAKKELESQLRSAKADQDVEAVAEITSQIKDVEVAQQAAKQEQQEVRQNQGPTPEFQSWQEENTWFRKDVEMTEDAIGIGTGYAASHPGKTQAEVLEYVSTKIKRMYPEKFGIQPQGKKVEDNRVEGGSSTRPAGKQKGKLDVSDLNDMEKSVMNTLIKRGALKEVAKKNNRSEREEYLAQLAERKAAE